MKISIITATYNSENHIRSAIESFIVQDYQDKELLIIDGKSKDKTLDIIKSLSLDNHKIISEVDKGIYDALNKGVNIADENCIIGILHSDDMFANQSVLSDVAQIFKQNNKLQAVYGDLQYVDRDDSNKIIRNWISGEFDFSKLSFGWMPPHPALFIKKECFKKFGNYDLQFKSAADYDLILRFLFKHKIKTSYLPKVLVKMRVGGLSNKSFKNRLLANKEDRTALKNNGVNFPNLIGIIKPLRKIGQYFIKNS